MDACMLFLNCAEVTTRKSFLITELLPLFLLAEVAVQMRNLYRSATFRQL